MLQKNERRYLIFLIVMVIILIFSTIYITFNCPTCNDIFSNKYKSPVIVYKLG